MRMFILSAVLFFVAGSAQAATLDIQGGQLFGATGVDVAGTLYDVQFIDGTCAALYIGCELSNPGSFGDQTFALLASQALDTQVFIDSGLGNFDSDPQLTNGCNASAGGGGVV